MLRRTRGADDRERPRFRAFISYAHADARVAAWLHRGLERYRVPPRLRSGAGDRLYPIFRDREEFAASTDLQAGIVDALGRSDALIVVCSPRSARSRWVDEEVRTFRALAPDRPVLALIADGEPFASELPGQEDAECFPPALRRAAGVPDPIAADLRPHGDGPRLAKLKLIAGLLGAPLAELTRRDEARRQRRLLAAAAVAALLIAVLGVMLAVALRTQREAERQRAQAEGLVEYMIGDLREQLEPIGRLSVMDSLGARALGYYRAQGNRSLDPDSLGRRARVLHLIGEIQNQRGNLDTALADFEAAAASTGELLRRTPGDGRRVYDHAQSVYWVGYIAWERGDPAKARANLTAYRDLTEALVRIDPNNEDWRAERGYGANNLGTLDLNEGRAREAKAAFTRALGIKRALLAADPRDDERRLSLGQALAWLADADEQLGDVAAAEALRAEEVRLYATMLAGAPEAAPARLALCNAERALSQLARAHGDPAAARLHAERAVSLSQALVRLDRSNMDWHNAAAAALVDLGEARLSAGDRQNAAASAEAALADYAALLARDGAVDAWRLGHVRATLLAANTALVDHRPATARALALRADRELDRLSPKNRNASNARRLSSRARSLLARASAAIGKAASARTLAPHVAPELDKNA